MVKIEDKKKKKSKLFWIIPIVLLISMIILGIYFFVNMDRCCATLKITEFTDAQLRNEINKTFFYDEGKTIIYPTSRLVEIKRGETDGVAIGINNLIAGEPVSKDFSYDVVAFDVLTCGTSFSKETAESWIVSGKEGSMSILHEDFSVNKVVFTIPANAPLCFIRYKVDVKADGTAYATDFFDMKVKAK